MPVFGTISFRSGVSFNFGNLNQKLGLFTMAHYGDSFFQSGGRFDLYFVPKAWGHQKKGFEFQLSAMTGLGYGSYRPYDLMYLDVGSSILPLQNQISYIYIWYKDSYGSSQRSGTVLHQSGRFRVAMENDFFGEHRSDKWRTAGVLLSYETDTVELGLKLVLWTGDSFDDNVIVHKETDYPARFGYRDLSSTKYGRFSIGALGVQARSDKYLGQSISVFAGVDAEQIRNIAQNKFMHDMWFVPRFLISYPVQNYPMLDELGNPYLFSNDTIPIRKPRPFIQIGMNDCVFY